MFRAQIQW